ncbi:oxidoreductase family protein-like protein [Stipitochalara longipes BDJ]|nr:oxidoreductase family protein-like protein [Stipitochalara longipes BDJ]
MAPIRVGLIGLSGAPPDKYEGTSWTSYAHLPYLTSSPDYEIVALLNSSVESGKAAITRYNLPATIKAYSLPEELANDPEVDLVVCSVRVDRHFLTVKPSIIAGKAIFVEWPLDRSLSVAQEMLSLSKQHGAKTIVGIQGSFSLVIRKMKEIVEKGKEEGGIGKVLSSTIVASIGNGDVSERKNVRYFLEREIGGNVVSIHFGHTLEFIAPVLGEFKTWNSLMAIRNSKKDIIDPANGNKVITKDAPNTVPDQILLQGTVSSGAAVSIHYRGGSPFPGTPSIQWWIQGSKGEIRLTSSSATLNVGRDDTKIEWFDKERGTVVEVKGDKDEWDELPGPARNIARVYEAYRKGEWVPDFEWAVKRHMILEEMWKRFDEGQNR